MTRKTETPIERNLTDAELDTGPAAAFGSPRTPRS